MSIYAYIKIPGIANSESTDERYGKEWIPITSVELSGSTLGEDSAYEKEQKNRQAAKRQKHIDFLIIRAQKTGREFTEKELESLKTKRKSDDKKYASDYLILSDLEEKYHIETSDGSLSFGKKLDSTSPKLHEMRLQCLQFASNEYIEGKIELHICRQIPSSTQKAGDTEVYIAYIFEKCLITEFDFDASESARLQESITISFEKIGFCVRQTELKWDSKGWDFLAEKEITPSVPRCPPKQNIK